MSEREGSRVSVVTWGAQNPGPYKPGCRGRGFRVRGLTAPRNDQFHGSARLRLIADDPGGLLAATEDHAMRWRILWHERIAGSSRQSACRCLVRAAMRATAGSAALEAFVQVVVKHLRARLRPMSDRRCRLRSDSAGVRLAFTKAAGVAHSCLCRRTARSRSAAHSTWCALHRSARIENHAEPKSNSEQEPHSHPSRPSGLTTSIGTLAKSLEA